MPHNTPCERCLRVGWVRMERIITGNTVTLSYHCGACAYVWQLIVPDLRLPVHVTLTLKKDRRKSA